MVPLGNEETGHIMARLIETLKQLPVREDPNLFKRCEPRLAIREKTLLDLQLNGSDIISVSAIDVSDSGVGFLCRAELPTNQRVGLRLGFDHESQFEPFEVRRGTSTIGGFKIGAIAC